MSVRMNLAINPTPGSVNFWTSNNGALYTHTYASGEVSVERKAGAAANEAATWSGAGLNPYNPVLPTGTKYQRAIEVWVDQDATMKSSSANGFTAGQALPAGQWTRVVQQFTAHGAAMAALAGAVTIPGVGTGVHVKLRRGQLIENPSGVEQPYWDGDTPDAAGIDYAWIGPVQGSMSTATDLWTTRTNRATNPRAVSTGGAGWTSGRPWGAGGAGTYSYATGQVGPAVQVVTNLATNPTPASVTGWSSNDGAFWAHTYAAGEISVNRIAISPNDPDAVASWFNAGFVGAANPVIPVGVNYQRSIELWVDAPATLAGIGLGSFTGGQPLAANQWTRVVEQFTGTGAAMYALAGAVRMPGAGLGVHVKMRRAQLVANPGGQTVSYFDGDTPAAGRVSHAWTGTANASTSTASTDATGITTTRRKTWSTAPSNNQDSGFEINDTSVTRYATTPREILAVSVWFRHTSATSKIARMRLQFFSQVPVASAVVVGGTVEGLDVTVPPNIWTRVGIVTQVPYDGVAMAIYPDIMTGGGGLWAVGNVLDATGLLIEQAGFTTYFDGSTPDTNSESYWWNGTVDASMSTTLARNPTPGAVQVWANGAWTPLSRGAKGNTGSNGAAGAAASERVQSVAHRALGASHNLNPGPGWTDMYFAATPLDGLETNSPIIAQNSAASGSPFFRFLKAGAYLVTVTMWLNAGSPPVGGRACLALFRNRPIENLIWAQNAFGQNGAGVQTLTALVLAQPSDSWYVSLFRSAGAASTHQTDMFVTPVGPCRTGTWDYAAICDHVDYNSGGSMVTSYSITPPVAINTVAAGDWLYLVHMNYYSTTNPVVTPPAGWEVVVPQQARYTSPEGISFAIWRKKYVPGDVCDVNLSLATYVRATLLVIRQANDDMPILSAFVAPRAGVNPSKITVPGGVANSSSVSIAMQHVPNQWAAPPPGVSSTATPGGYWFTAGTGAPENLWLCAAWMGPPRSAGTAAIVDFNFPAGVTADAGQINGITMSWPRTLQP